jgi:cellulose synthase/poly-beta-1,6-N-acetylglucosamine synthase-like glycosyltransferase
MEPPLISVVMVVCNADHFLCASIESILCQTLTEFEFIIVDFGSTDSSNSIISSYAAKDGRIKFHEIAPCGLAEARNAACCLARGEYIAMMDADDVANPKRLAWEFTFLEEHPKVGLVGGATEWINASGKSLRIERFPTKDHEIRAAFAVHCPFCQPTVVVRREAFLLVGGYRTLFVQAEDYDLWMRIAEHFEVANLEEVVLKYRIHAYQLTLRKHMQQCLYCLAARLSASSRKSGQPDPLNTIAEITPAILAGAGISEAAQQVMAADKYLFWIRTMCQAGEYSTALQAANQVLRSSEWKQIERWQIADLYLAIAQIYWRDKKHFRCLLAAGRAVATRPKILGRPLRPLFEKDGIEAYRENIKMNDDQRS